MSRAEGFDALYRGNDDPWLVLTSDYERDKYAATLAVLARPRYRRTLEVGCSIGAMTVRLAERSDAVVAVDVSAVAIEKARARCAGLPVAFVHAEVPEGWPAGTFDLVVLSEVLYFLDAAELDACAARTAAGLAPDGEVVLVNYLGETDTAHTGDAAAERFLAAAAAAGLVPSAGPRTASYRIDRLVRPA
jgi:SAM-dependent methyltransferase